MTSGLNDFTLDSALRSDLFSILGPSFTDPTERRAIVWLATEHDRELIEDLDWTGPPEIFIVRLLERLETAQNLRPILSSLLQSAESRLDAPTRERATRLRQRLTNPTIIINNETDVETSIGSAHFRVFISSPSDVADERAVATQVIEHLAYDPLVRGWLTTEVVAWDGPTPVPLIAGTPPQASIDQAGLTPESCDVVLVILWSRIGTRNPVDSSDRKESGTENEYWRALASFRISGRPFVIVYHRTDPAWVQLGSPDLDERRQQWAGVQEFISNITEGGSGEGVSGINNYGSTDEFRILIESHLRELVRRRYGGIQSPVKPTSSTETTSSSPILDPYPGLRAFDIDDSVVFFGRGTEVDALVDRLAAPQGRLVAIVGASGSGKSSLVSAGLLPRLQHDAIRGSSRWRVIRTTPDRFGLGDPFISLAIAIEPNAFDSRKVSKEWRGGELLRRIKSAERTTEAAPTLLIIDQFEELFTSINPAKVAPFIDQLLDLLSDDSSRIILTIRSDFYDRCVEHATFASALRQASFPLSAPGLGSLYQMITRPAETAGIMIERGLAERILNDTGVHSGALALMAFTLSELFAAASGTGVLRHDQYDRLGGVKGAIGSRAATAFDSLDTEAKEQLPVVFRQLITVNEDGAPTRQRGRPSQWAGNAAAQSRFLQAFVDARLLVSGLDADGHPTVEVAHEALFQSWPLLMQWIDDVRDDLRALRELERATLEWLRHDRARSYLWTEERMLPARTAVGRLGLGGAEPEVATAITVFLTPEVDRLAAELSTPGLSHNRRAQIGERMAELGDTRPGVGVTDGIPTPEWCKVTGSRLRLDGLAEGFQVNDFYISKYPVTSVQYEAFVTAEDGYHDLQWWENIPRRSVPPEAYHGIPNHPMENLSWYEAIAFCRWLSNQLNFEVRLPTELEWQMAANGGDSGRLFPWGNVLDGDRANTFESGLGRTVAVGMYPLGAAPCGALDMAGNVWEWCLNESADPNSTDIFEVEQRAVRGGCWYHELQYGVTSFRNPAWDYAAPRTQLRGFRIIGHPTGQAIEATAQEG